LKILTILAPLVVVLLVVFVFLAPIGPVPGVLIGGTEAEIPDNWGETSDTHEIRLEVPGPLPRVVIIWVVQWKGDLHIVGYKESGWVSKLENGGPVRMRMGDRTFSLTATALATGWEPVMDAYLDKYRPDYPEIVDGFPSKEEAAGAFSVFRLSAR
jgi:hypothetical protein